MPARVGVNRLARVSSETLVVPWREPCGPPKLWRFQISSCGCATQTTRNELSEPPASSIKDLLIVRKEFEHPQHASPCFLRNGGLLVRLRRTTISRCLFRFPVSRTG